MTLTGYYPVNALLKNNGNLFAGGNFSIAGETNALNIARWDGTNWLPLGTGIGGPASQDEVRALASGHGYVYAAGSFGTAGGINANNIARWDGTNWSALGSGMSGASGIITLVHALATHSSYLYAGGDFNRAGGVDAFFAARWDGTNWSSLGNGPTDEVLTLASSTSGLILGGHFIYANGINVNHVARWDGTNFMPLGSGVNGPVFALAVRGNDVYVGGSFTMAGGIPATNIAKWDGVFWSPLAEGVNATVKALAANASSIYAAGDFTMAGGVGVNHIARWDGANWIGLDEGLGYASEPVLALVVDGNDLYTGGGFEMAGRIKVNYVAKWDNIHWSGLGGMGDTVGVPGGLLNVASALASYRNEIYGTLFKWDGTNALRWNGSGSFWDMIVSGLDLFVGGQAPDSVGNGNHGVAKWNGTNWQALGSGIQVSDFGPYVYAVITNGNAFYAAGNFSTVAGRQIISIARWDGTNWWPLGTGLFGSDGVDPASVYALAVKGGDIYAGGFIEKAGNVWTHGVAKWNGTNWSALGVGFPDNVHALTFKGNDLYAGGEYGFFGKWDGTNWFMLPGGAAIYSMAANGNDIYAGGSFNAIGGVPAHNVAKWDGTGWSALGNGVNGEVHDIVIQGNELFLSGFFTSAGGKPSHRFAIWHIAPSLQIERSGSGIELNWPIPFSNYVLETTESLTITNWMEANPPPTSNRYELSPFGASKLFRLRQR